MKLRFEQIKDDLLRVIRSDYLPGERFLSQREIMRRYEASLATVEHALRKLVEERVIVRQHGRGTFVASPLEQIIPRTNCVAIVLMSNVRLSRQHFYTEILDAIHESLSAQGYTFSHLYQDKIASSEQMLQQIANAERFDGALLVGNTPSQLADMLLNTSFPFVVVDALLHVPGLCMVVSDNRGGVTEAMRFLIGHGHRRIGFATHYLAGNFIERYEAYCQVLEENQLPIRSHWILKYAKEGHTEGILDRMFAGGKEDSPTAIFAANDSIACDVAKELARRGLRIPEDVSIIGYDGELITELHQPPLCTMKVPKTAMGEKSVECLLAMFKGREPASVTLPVTLLDRGSVTPPHEMTARGKRSTPPTTAT